MRFQKDNEIYIAGVGTCLPGFHFAADAVATGVYAAEDHERDAYISVSVADEAPPQLAARAARQAMDASGVESADIAILLHASVTYQGVDLWPAASYVHREVLAGGRHAPSIDVAQASNGGLGAIELAAAYLMAAPERRAALVSSADCFRLPLIDRWRCDSGMVLGDGAGAVVLTRDAGFARLLALRTIVDSRLESMFRGREPFGLVSGHNGLVDTRRRRADYFENAERDTAIQRVKKGLTDAIELALQEAETHLDQVTRVIFPAVGLTALQRAYLEPLQLSLDATTWEMARRTGHVGGADQFIGLHHLIQSGTLKSGDRVLMIGIGAGFSWSCAVLEMTPRLASGFG